MRQHDDPLAHVLNLDVTLDVVDIGANPIDGAPPYKSLLDAGLARLIGFEPDPDALTKLNDRKGPYETYLPHAVFDGERHELRICAAQGMSSLLEPNREMLESFHGFAEWGKVRERREIPTVRLDDVEEIKNIDYLKIDIQGGELEVFRNGTKKLSGCLVIHTKVEFLPMYVDQPLFSEVELFLRGMGYVFHHFSPLVSRAVKPALIRNDIYAELNQIFWADAVFIRDFSRFQTLTPDQLKNTAVILHDAYGSWDVAHRALMAHDAQAGTDLAGQYMAYLSTKVPGMIGTADEIPRPDTPSQARTAFSLLDAGKWAQAAEAYPALVDQDPFDADLRFNLAFALHQGGSSPEAVTQYLACLALDPARARAANNLGNLLSGMGRHEEAAEAFGKAIQADPNHANAHQMLGFLLLSQDKPAEALPHLADAARLNPGGKEPRFGLAQTLESLDRLDEAIRAYQSIIEDFPEAAHAHVNLAGVFARQGLMDQALEHLEQARELDPSHPVIRSNIILDSHYTPHVNAATRLAEARAWAQRFEAPLKSSWPRHANDSDPERPLRIGYLSSDFRRHPIGFFMSGVFTNHDRDRFVVYTYSSTPSHDWLTEVFRKHAHQWREVRSLDAAAIAGMVRDDRIDILVDLAGHSAGNHLLVLAHRPAPVQMVAGGHFCTTGLEAVDYLIADAHHAPADHEGEFTENLIRLPGGYVCYSPPDYAPAVSALPALASGHVTFGCLNNAAKLGPWVIDLWARLLGELPEARLFLGTKVFSHPGTRDRYRSLFEERGIAGTRIEFAGSAPHADYLGYYNRMDVALDPFPFSGGLTTCEALWMGVPVVTLGGGNSFASRHSVGHLNSAGMSHLIADTPEAYIEKARALVRDLDALSEHRRTLRPRLAGSPLCDCAGHTRDLEAAYTRHWRIKRQSPLVAEAVEGR